MFISDSICPFSDAASLSLLERFASSKFLLHFSFSLKFSLYSLHASVVSAVGACTSHSTGSLHCVRTWEHASFKEGLWSVRLVVSQKSCPKGVKQMASHIHASRQSLSFDTAFSATSLCTVLWLIWSLAPSHWVHQSLSLHRSFN